MNDLENPERESLNELKILTREEFLNSLSDYKNFVNCIPIIFIENDTLNANAFEKFMKAKDSIESPEDYFKRNNFDFEKAKENFGGFVGMMEEMCQASRAVETEEDLKTFLEDYS